MQLLLPAKIIQRLLRELRRAGHREIGGLLMGEHVRDETFRVLDISVQRSGGSHACFIRDPRSHQAQLQRFFAQTGQDYARFNYLGEWHSHPSFDPVPSATDAATMQSIVDDPDVGVNFLVLLIPRLDSNKDFEASATAFRARTRPLAVPLLMESEPFTERETGLSRWLHKIFRGAQR